MGYTADQLPYVGEVPGRPGLHVAGGYSGHGNVPGYVAGQEIADAIVGQAGEEPLFGADRWAAVSFFEPPAASCTAAPGVLARLVWPAGRCRWRR